MRPSQEALKGKPRHSVEWTERRHRAFAAPKAALANANMLLHPSSTALIAITSDASEYALGAIYEQWEGGDWQPLAFFSRHLHSSERKCTTFD